MIRDRDLGAITRLERPPQRDVQTVAFVLERERPGVGRDGRDRHAFVARRRRRRRAAAAARRFGAGIVQARRGRRASRRRAELAEIQIDRCHPAGNDLHGHRFVDDELVGAVAQRDVEGVVRDADSRLPGVGVGLHARSGACDSQSSQDQTCLHAPSIAIICFSRERGRARPPNISNRGTSRTSSSTTSHGRSGNASPEIITRMPLGAGTSVGPVGRSRKTGDSSGVPSSKDATRCGRHPSSSIADKTP